MLHLKRWTGVSAGSVLSSEIMAIGKLTGSDHPESNKARHAIASASFSRGVKDPRHAVKLHAREPRDPVVIRTQSRCGSEGERDER
jgi:hypothetical protein